MANCTNKIQYMLLSFFLMTSMLISATTVSKDVSHISLIRKYYTRIQKFAENPWNNFNTKNEIKDMFFDRNGYVYNDLFYNINPDQGKKVEGYSIDGVLAYIGELYNNDNIRLTFNIDFNSISYKTIKKPAVNNANEEYISYINLKKTVGSSGRIFYTTNEVFEIAKNKIISIQKQKVDFMLALNLYEQKQYSKALETFQEDAESNGSKNSAYWLAMMLLKKQGCSNLNDKVRKAIALFWLAKFNFYKELNFLQVDKKPDVSCAKPINDGLLTDINSKGYYGYLNKAGDVKIPYIYDNAEAFKNGLAIVQKNRQYGVIDVNGNTVIPFKYIKISSFDNGCAIATKANHKYGIIDNTGNEKVPFIYDDIIKAKSGLYIAHTWSKDGAIDGVIDVNGAAQIPFGRWKIEYNKKDDVFICEIYLGKSEYKRVTIKL